MDPRPIENALRADIAASKTPSDLEAVRFKYLGRKGVLTAFSPPSARHRPTDRPRLGAESNRLKSLCESLLDGRRRSWVAATRISTSPPSTARCPQPAAWSDAVTSSPKPSVTSPSSWRAWATVSRAAPNGTRVLQLPGAQFSRRAPVARPARHLLHLRDILLRAHTSPIQVRFMEAHKPPLKIYAPGRVYRNEALDASHQADFHQVEGLYVDTDVTMADLRGDLLLFLRELFGAASKCVSSRTSFRSPSRASTWTCRASRATGAAARSAGTTGWTRNSRRRACAPNVLRRWVWTPIAIGLCVGVGVDRIAMICHSASPTFACSSRTPSLPRTIRGPLMAAVGHERLLVVAPPLLDVQSRRHPRARYSATRMHGIKVERLALTGLTERLVWSVDVLEARPTRRRIGCACSCRRRQPDPARSCGASNVAAGQRRAVALVGSELPNG